jgi:hypothetical protein
VEELKLPSTAPVESPERLGLPSLYPAGARRDVEPEFVADSKKPDNSWEGGHRPLFRHH